MAPLAAAMTALKIVSTVSGALGNKKGGTPNVNIPKNNVPKGDDYTPKKPKKPNGDENSTINNDPGTGTETSGQRTEEQVSVGGDGMIKTGLRTPIKGSGFTMNQSDYDKFRSSSQ